jgi:outer membrane protein, multidrug efflux system
MRTSMRVRHFLVNSFLGLCCLVVAAPAWAQAEDILPLDAAVREALVYSPQLKASQEKLVQAKSQLWQAYGLLLPFVTVQGNYTRADERISLDFGSGFADVFALAALNCNVWDEGVMGPLPSLCTAVPEPAPAEGEESDEDSSRVIQELNNWDGSITVGMSLLNARTLPLIKNVYTGEDIAILQQTFAEEQLVFAVVQTYYGTSTAQAAVKLMQENLATAMRSLDFTEIRRKNGVALENERIRAALAVLQARNGLDRAQAGSDLALSSLAILIGRDSADFIVEETPENPWAGIETAFPDGSRLERRVDMRLLDKMSLLAERGVTDIWMKFVPTIGAAWNFSGSSNTGFAGRNTQWRAMLTLNWSIFEGGMRLAELDIARSKVRETGYNKQAALLAARNEVQTAISGINMAQIDLATALEMSTLAQENLTLVEKQYKHGVAQQTVMLDAQTQVQSARIQTLQGNLRLALAQVSLAKAMGLISKTAFAD